MMFRFFLPDFEFELDEWQQHLAAGEVTLEEVLQALLDHIQPIVQPELFAEFPAEAVDPEGEEVPLALVAYFTRVTAIATRLNQMDKRLNRIEKGIARIEQQWGGCVSRSKIGRLDSNATVAVLCIAHPSIPPLPAGGNGSATMRELVN